MSVRFSLANDAVIRNLQGEEVTLESIKDCTDYPIWGILLVNDRHGHTAIRQMCDGELKIKKIHSDFDITDQLNLSRKIERSKWDTEFTIGSGSSLVSLIWSESYMESAKVFDVVAVWEESGGFKLFNGPKKFESFTMYNLKSTQVYDVDFEMDISSLQKYFPPSKILYPCIPYVQTLEGQDTSSYSVHYFTGVRGTLIHTFNRSFSDSSLLSSSEDDNSRDETLSEPSPVRSRKGKGKRKRKKSERMMVYPSKNF